MAIGVQQLQRRATAAVWAVSPRVLAQGELGVTTDTGIIKIGDGVNVWNDLDPAFDSQYLPILGKAADSELLDGINSSGFIQLGDVTTTATADKVVRRLNDGTMKAAAGVSTNDVVNYDQMTAANVAVRKELVSRTVTSAFTLALTDIAAVIIANASAYATSIVATIPTNATVAFPVGSIVDILSLDKGFVTLTPAGGVILTGPTIVFGGGSWVRLLKTATDTWVVLTIVTSPGPILRRKIKTTTVLTTSTFLKLRLDGADSGTALFSNNKDTLGTNQQYNSGTDLYKVTCQRSGWYDVKAQLTLAENLNGRIYVKIKINNIDQNFGHGSSRQGSPDIGPMFSAHIPLTVGDYVEVYGFQEGGANSTVSETNDSHSVFEWAWHRPL